MPMQTSSGRCHLVYAPEGTSAREANDLLNSYVADGRRGIAVWHDHFVGEHGTTAVGFAAQTSFTLEQYRGLRLDELAAAEPDDPRYWWRRREA